MKHLTREQRYGISLMLQEGKSRKDIAKVIGVSTSTISRELRKNCDMRNGTYNYDLAQRKYETRLKLRGRKPVFTKEMKDTVVSLLEEGYSPEQIKGRSNVEGFAMVSHETMYRWIWEDKRKKGTLYQYLRRKGKKYNKRGNSLAGRGYIPNRVDIEERPAIVDLKERFGDLEIDTVIGSNHKGALDTINDRLTSKVWIRKLSEKDAATLALKTIEALQPIKDLIHTITADNGKEFAKHQEIAKELEISFYFCKPYHSWERGANENMNGLIRQYIPKGTDFSGITDEFVAWVEDKLNNMPYVSESIVVQQNGKLVGLVYPDFDDAFAHGLKNEDLEQVMEENRVALNQELPAYSQIAKMKIYPEEFEKTPKKSIKRFLYQEAKG